ncbi:MAG: SCO6880 family protein [Actinomycetota bacterium]
MNQHEPRRYRFAGRDRTGWILGFTGAQCLTLGVAVVAAGLILNSGSAAPLAVLPLAGGVGLAFARVAGVPVLEWLPAHAAWAVRRAAGRTAWQARLAVTSAAGPDETAQPDLPACLAGVTVTEVPAPEWAGRSGSGVGVVEDRGAGTVTGTLRVRGGAFRLEDEGEQDRMVAGWGEALAAFCAEAGPVAWVRWSEWAAPAGLDAHVAHLEERATAPGDDPAVVAYRELLDRAARTTTAHEVLVSVTIDARRVHPRPGSRQRRGRDGTRLDVIGALLAELRLLALRLEAAGLVAEPPLSARELATVVRLRLDPSCRADLAGRRRSLAAQAGLVSVPNAGPLATVEHRRSFEADGSQHRCFQITEWPRRDVPAGWMEPLLLDGAGTRTVSLTCFPVAPSRSARQVNRDSTRLVTDAELRERKGFRIGVAHRRAQAAVAEREEELAAGHGDVEYVGLVAVTAPDAASLDAACAEYRQLAARVGLELRALDANHDLAVAAVLPLGRPVPVRRFG